MGKLWVLVVNAGITAVAKHNKIIWDFVILTFSTSAGAFFHLGFVILIIFKKLEIFFLFHFSRGWQIKNFKDQQTSACQQILDLHMQYVFLGIVQFFSHCNEVAICTTVLTIWSQCSYGLHCCNMLCGIIKCRKPSLTFLQFLKNI